MVPLVVDGTVQLLTNYESNNYRRLITGFLFGIGLCNFVVIAHFWLIDFIKAEMTKLFGPPPYINLFKY